MFQGRNDWKTPDSCCCKGGRQPKYPHSCMGLVLKTVYLEIETKNKLLCLFIFLNLFNCLLPSCSHVLRDGFSFSLPFTFWEVRAGSLHSLHFTTNPSKPHGKWFFHWSPQWAPGQESCWGRLSLKRGCLGFLLSLAKVNLFQPKSPSLGEGEEQVGTIRAFPLGYFFDLTDLQSLMNPLLQPIKPQLIGTRIFKTGL